MLQGALAFAVYSRRKFLETQVPHRDYDYADYYSKDLLEECDYEDIISPAEHAFLSKTKDVAERQLGRNDVVHQDAFQVEEDDDFSDDSDSDSETKGLLDIRLFRVVDCRKCLM